MSKRARAVIGANFGDEGKGLFVDFLCAREGADVVVRYNGGAQAGHTVVTPSGERHVFGHFGSGTFLNVPTYLSQFFVVNPLLFLKELEILKRMGYLPVVMAHPTCLVTTFADMIINQCIEDKRAAQRHGSVGVGVNETIERSQLGPLRITMAELWNGVDLVPRLQEICGKYAKFRTDKRIEKSEPMIEAFVKACDLVREIIVPAGMALFTDPVFEGAQGLLLDMDNKQFFPHLTRSKTGMHNVRILCKQVGIDSVEAYYVSRTYVTRHGAGPLPGEDPKMSFADDTNVSHPYQGSLRFAPIDYDDMLKRCVADRGDLTRPRFVVTHCDQLKCEWPAADYHSFGPRRSDVEKVS